MDLGKQKESGGGDGGIRTHVPISRQNDFESCAEKDFPEKSRSERVSLSLNFWTIYRAIPQGKSKKWRGYE